jgi:hypothetical protein
MGGCWRAYFHRSAGSFLITVRDPTYRADAARPGGR